MSTEPELWKSIPGFEGYEVSNLGHVRSYRTHGGKISDSPILIDGWIDRGYPRVGLRKTVGGRLVYKHIHRLILETFIGPCPKGYTASHLDGNPSNCVSANLIWEPHKLNCQRKKQHGTWQGQENHPMAKFTKEDILNMKKMYTEQSLSSWDIAAHYKTSPGHIIKILNGDMWKNVGENIATEMRRGSRHGMSKLTEEKVLEIRKLHKEGVSAVEISEKYDIHQSTISYIVNNKTWQHVK